MNFSALKDFMDHLTSWRIPGNDISVYIENREVFRYQSGYADLENKIKMPDDCLLNIYSCSKVATVTAAMQLLEKGRLMLDTPLYEYIPEFREMQIKDADGNTEKAENPITIRHLFTMTAGITYTLPDELKQEAEQKTEGRFDTLAVIRAMAKMPLSFEPGTRWQYSFCHDILAGVVEVISGKKFRDYMKENIFEPLGMKDSSYHLSEKDKGRLAPQYNFINDDAGDDIVAQQIKDSSKIGGHLERTDGTNHLVSGSEYDSGGAGIITTVSDYAKFAGALANGGVGSTGERILSPAAIDLMRTNQLTEQQKKAFDWQQLAGYGYGLGVRTMMDRAAGSSLSSVGEFGWGGAAGASVLIDPEKHLSFFYSHHMLNPQEAYYQPRLRNVVYSCID